MERLPPVEEQEWLLDCLRMLLRRRGADPLLVHPLVTEDQLGRWSPDARGVAAVGRRLLDRVALHDVELRVTAVPGGAGPPALYHPEAPLWLVSCTQGSVHVAVAGDAAADRRALVGLLAHEVAHVWRNHRDLEVVEPDTEERLTDLSAVYLGLGLLTANLAARRERPGALGVEALAWLLAVRVIARRQGCLATCGVARRLDPEPRRAFAEALRAVRRIPGGVAWRLRLPGHDAPAPPRPSRAAPRVDPMPSPVGEENTER